MPDRSWPLQRKLLRAPNTGFNAEVYRHFKQADDTTGRTALRDSLLIGTKDSRSTALFKIQYFRDFVQRVQDRPTIVGELKESYDQRVSYHCQVQMVFEQDKSASPKNKRPLSAEISFRIDETHTTITEAKINALAAKIKAELTSGTNGYRWSKGKYLTTYKDLSKGYNLAIYALSETEGEQVVRKVLAIQNHTFEENFFNLHKPRRDSDNTPGKVTILGESVDKPRWRPTATVEFRYAELCIWGLADPITLVDIEGRRRRRRPRTIS